MTNTQDKVRFGNAVIGMIGGNPGGTREFGHINKSIQPFVHERLLLPRSPGPRWRGTTGVSLEPAPDLSMAHSENAHELGVP